MKTIVHTTQQIYRLLVDVASRPGHVKQADEAVKNYSTFSDAALLVGMTLFDNEITYFTNDKTMKNELKVLTGGVPSKDYRNTDFIVLKEADLKPAYFTDVLHGVLISPEKSTTLLIEADSIGEGNKYRLTGPGIKEATDLQLSLSNEWIELRNDVCKEFPLGIDLILTDQNNNVVMIPRTTKVEVL